jgi:hypothetical protein
MSLWILIDGRREHIWRAGQIKDEREKKRWVKDIENFNRMEGYPLRRVVVSRDEVIVGGVE